jgi:hypothetical protein
MNGKPEFSAKKANNVISGEIFRAQTFGELLKVLEDNYDTSYNIPLLLKGTMAIQLPELLKQFKK